MRSLLAALTVLCLAACTQPPPTAYVGGTTLTASGSNAVSLGTNASGESCNQLSSGAPDTVDIFCGTWQEPAARVRTGGPENAAALLSLATSGPWREAIDLRFACNAPTTTSVLAANRPWCCNARGGSAAGRRLR